MLPNRYLLSDILVGLLWKNKHFKTFTDGIAIIKANQFIL